MSQQRITLRPGKDKAVRHRHPWIFSGAVASGAKGCTGDLLPVYSAEGQLLGTGYFNSESSIVGRMVCFDERPPLEAMSDSIDKAIALRQMLFNHSDTTGYRVINAEGDGLPGLIVDRYGDTLVIQIATLGMDRLRSWIVDQLRVALKPRRIYEKSLLPVRKEEGLEDCAEWLYGDSVDQVEIIENGLKFLVPIMAGQKTGFFLDQREMRALTREYASGRRILNCFSYTGAFGVAALAGGATHVTNVDTSEEALQVALETVSLNGFRQEQHRPVAADVFRFLRDEALDYDLIILDPPAFAKRRKDIINGCRGYKDINRLAMSKMPVGSLLLTSSCSHFVDDALFQKVVFQASIEAGRTVRILDRHHYAPDHPVNICHPEAHYLKSLLLYVE